jgi:P-type Cu+ transporter
MDDNGHVSSFFDSTIFLTFFLLLGRTMETWSKAKTASAVEGLTQLRPSEVMMVVDPSERLETPESKSPDTPISKEKDLFPDNPKQGNLVKMPVDMLEVGDVVVVPHGAAPPSDGKIVFGTTSFDESSLTGEAAPVLKTGGDTAFAGTINQGKTVHVKLEKVAGSSM